MPLPSLGRIDPPPPSRRRPVSARRSHDARCSHAAARDSAAAESVDAAPTARQRPKTAAQLTLERQLSGVVFSAAERGIAESATPADHAPRRPRPASRTGELAPLLRPSVDPAVRAQVLPTQRLLLPKGAFIDCTLETAIDSTLPGMTTCVMATDTFGVDGQVVLLERGTKLVGETRGRCSRGRREYSCCGPRRERRRASSCRWHRRAPTNWAAPGLPGTVDRHFWQRFGAAMLVSVIDGAMQGRGSVSRGGNGTVIVNPSATQDVMTEVLKGTINIPPTVVKHQGDRIQVLVARDLDFRSVYELRSVAAGR